MSTDVNGVQTTVSTVSSRCSVSESFAIVSDQLSNPLYGSSNPERESKRATEKQRKADTERNV